MATLLYDFTKSDYLENWDNLTNFLIKNNGVQTKKNRTSDTNSLYGLAITEVAGTTIAGATQTTDWDLGKFTILTGTAEQAITMDIGSGSEVYFKKFKISMLPESGIEVFGAVTVEVSNDESNWYTIGYIQDTSDSTVYIYSSQTGGVYGRYLRFTFAGTTADADKIVIADIQAYRATYPIPFQVIKHREVLETNSLSAVAGNITESGSAVPKLQFYKNTDLYYWDGSAWTQVGSDTSRYDEYSCTITDANTNIGTLITGTSNVLIGLQLVLIPTEDITPACQDITLTT